MHIHNFQKVGDCLSRKKMIAKDFNNPKTTTVFNVRFILKNNTKRAHIIFTFNIV